MLGLTQQQMAELIGVTYQQAHKYEKGINRVAAGRLCGIAGALGVEVGYFYEGLQIGGGFALIFTITLTKWPRRAGIEVKRREVTT